MSDKITINEETTCPLTGKVKKEPMTILPSIIKCDKLGDAIHGLAIQLVRDSLGQVTNTIVRLKYETYQYKNYSLVANKEVPIIEEHQEDSQKSQISRTVLKKNQVQIPKMPEIIQLNPASEVIRHQPVPLVFVPKHPRPQVIQRQPTLMINPQNVPKMMQSATTQQVIQNNPNPPVQILQSMNSSQKPTQID